MREVSHLKRERRGYKLAMEYEERKKEKSLKEVSYFLDYIC